MAQFQILQPETTYPGSPIQPMKKGLPKTTRSLCPECTQLIDATIFEEAGKVVMEKRCQEHGEFRDIVYSDAKLYLKMENGTSATTGASQTPPSPPPPSARTIAASATCTPATPAWPTSISRTAVT